MDLIGFVFNGQVTPGVAQPFDLRTEKFIAQADCEPAHRAI